MQGLPTPHGGIRIHLLVHIGHGIEPRPEVSGSKLLVRWLAPVFEQLSAQQERISALIIDPYFTPLGLVQGVWNMFCVAPDETQQFEAKIKFANETRVLWKSPDWRPYHWLEKKRLQRIMTWHEFMADEPVWGAKDAFARKLAKDHGDDYRLRSEWRER